MMGRQRLAKGELGRAWRRYTRDRRIEDRNRLVTHYAPLVNRHAALLTRRMSRRVSYDEVRSAAFDGLMQAVESYDPTRATQFEAYCRRRLTGAVLDWLRGVDTQSRAVRRFEKNRDAIIEEHDRRHGFRPPDSDIARDMGMSPARYARLSRRARMGNPIPFSAVEHPSRARHGAGRHWDIRDRSAADPTHRVARATLAEYLFRSLTVAARFCSLACGRGSFFRSLTVAARFCPFACGRGSFFPLPYSRGSVDARFKPISKSTQAPNHSTDMSTEPASHIARAVRHRVPHRTSMPANGLREPAERARRKERPQRKTSQEVAMTDIPEMDTAQLLDLLGTTASRLESDDLPGLAKMHGWALALAQADGPVQAQATTLSAQLEALILGAVDDAETALAEVRAAVAELTGECDDSDPTPTDESSARTERDRPTAAIGGYRIGRPPTAQPRRAHLRRVA
jgi:RNA polymerase sigma factor for flagellar operon FliA